MATTANGTYKYCDSEGRVAISFICAGPSCKDLGGSFMCSQPNSTHNYWFCTNRFKCSGSSSVVSTFFINQSSPNVTTETQHINIDGSDFTLVRDPTGNVTVENTTSSSSHSSVPKSLAFCPKVNWLLLVLALLAIFAVEAEAASKLCWAVVAGKVASGLGLASDTISGDVKGIQEHICEMGVEKLGGEDSRHGQGYASALLLCSRSLTTSLDIAVLNVAVRNPGPPGQSVRTLVSGVAIIATITVSSACIELVSCMRELLLQAGAKVVCNSPEPPEPPPSSTCPLDFSSCTGSNSPYCSGPGDAMDFGSACPLDCSDVDPCGSGLCNDKGYCFSYSTTTPDHLPPLDHPLPPNSSVKSNTLPQAGAGENSVCETQTVTVTTTEKATETITKTTTATITVATDNTGFRFNATSSPGSYSCQCLNDQREVNEDATNHICPGFQASGNPCYPVHDPVDFVYDCWSVAGSNGGICF